MHLNTFISLALAAGSALSAPVPRPGIPIKRDNNAPLQRRDQPSKTSQTTLPIPEITTQAAVPDDLKARDNVVYETVVVDGSSGGSNGDSNVVWVTEVAYVTVVVTGDGQAAATTAVPENVVTTTAAAAAEETTAHEQQAETTTEAQQAQTSTSASSSTSTSSGGSISAVPECLTYSPYNEDSSCKDSDTVYSDLSVIANAGIKSVRIYGTDCNSISTVEPNALKLGLQIDQGFWIGSDGVDSIDSGVQDLINWVQNSNNGDWGLFTTITVGNEAIYGGYVDGATLLGKIKSVKTTLRNAGWTGTVTTAEPPQSYIDYTDLCTDTDGIDYVGVNAHPYFDPSSSPETAGDFVLTQISTVKNACNNRDVSITETGYPSAGNTNGLNVPSKANQAIAIAKIMSALDNKGVMFTMLDDKWKAPGPYNVEQHFGIMDLF